MTALPIYSILFYIFAGALLAAALWVILAKNPVQAVLSLVLCFFIASLLWMMLQAEFLALVLIFVYVGAVMTLFLF
ncbi:MAG TPA: NADH-quinone oxidoreductase subunit J, partial [Coxiellaceae bacterium]|nr:NADH-quinone oxidoreductase subunit J [Coxiellaceae bacterium]